VKRLAGLIAGILALLGLAVLAYFWATGLFASLEAYRSPLHSNPPAPGESLGQPAARRVVFVLIDALRTDTAQNAAVMPVLDQLRQQGASANVHSRPPVFLGTWLRCAADRCLA